MRFSPSTAKSSRTKQRAVAWIGAVWLLLVLCGTHLVNNYSNNLDISIMYIIKLYHVVETVLFRLFGGEEFGEWPNNGKWILI